MMIAVSGRRQSEESAAGRISFAHLGAARSSSRLLKSDSVSPTL